MKPITYPIAFVAAYVALVMHQAGAYAIAAGFLAVAGVALGWEREER